MSFDLLAEFGDPQNNDKPSYPQLPRSSTKPNNSAFDDFSFLNTTSTAPQQGLPAQHQPTNNDIWGDLSSLSSPATKQTLTPAASFDPWGDLSSLGAPVTKSASEHPFQPIPTLKEKNGTRPTISDPEPGIPRVSTIELFSNNIADLAESSGRGSSATGLKLSNTKISSAKVPRKKDENVLFDAEDEQSEDDDDDFGDFETVAEPEPELQPYITNRTPDSYNRATPQNLPRRPPEISLEAANMNTNAFPYPQAPKSPAFQERNPFAGMKITTPTGTPTQEESLKLEDSPVTAWPTFESKAPTPAPYHDSPAAKPQEDDDWGDFADLPETPAVNKNSATKPRPTEGIEADAWAWDAVDSPPAPVTAPVKETALPPSNIPPPSILLSIFPRLLDLPSSTLFKPVGSQSFSLKNRILSDPGTIDFLRAYIVLATVAARLIAGRKLRWKRDHHLAQSMSIGQAAVGGKGGMKLTNVDKSEATREDREAADVIQSWRDQVGRLRSAVATANQSVQNQSAHLVVPEIQEIMPVRTATGADGALTAPKACLICGLKREERIAKIDTKVEDSFGEWWIDHWGHRACRNFWQEHEAQLKSR